MRISNRRHTDLAELVDSLKPVEREAVRKALEDRKPRPAPKQVLLFELMCASEAYSDEDLLANGVAPNKNALHQLRYTLYDAILEVLQSLRRSPKHLELVERLLQQEKLLFERHLFGLGLRTLNRARQYAEKYGLWEELTRIHKRLQDEYRFLANTDERLKRRLLPTVKSNLREFRARIATQYERQKQEIFSLQVYWQLEEKGRPNSETDLHRMSSFYIAESPPPPGEAADMHAVLHYHNNWAHLSMLKSDWSTAFNHTKRAWEAMIAPEQLRERSTEEVFSAVVLTANYLMVSAYSLSFEAYKALDGAIEDWAARMRLDDAPKTTLDFQRYLCEMRCSSINSLYEQSESIRATYHSKQPTDWGQSKLDHSRHAPFYEALAAWGCSKPHEALRRLAFYQRHPSASDSPALALSVLTLRLSLLLELDEEDGLELLIREFGKLVRQFPEHATVQCIASPLSKLDHPNAEAVKRSLQKIAPAYFDLAAQPWRNAVEVFFTVPVLFEASTIASS